MTRYHEHSMATVMVFTPVFARVASCRLYSDRDPFMSQPIDEEALTRLQEICRRFGLDITRAVQQGVMLTITPTSLDHLPDAAVLRELADALGGDGVRYVTLDLSEEPIND